MLYQKKNIFLSLSLSLSFAGPLVLVSERENEPLIHRIAIYITPLYVCRRYTSISPLFIFKIFSFLDIFILFQISKISFFSLSLFLAIKSA